MVNWATLSGIGHRVAPRGLREAIADRMVFTHTSARAFRRAHEDLDGELLELHVRAFTHPFTVRAITDDLYMLREVVTYRDVMPPNGMRPASILNVGANIGIAIALLATEFPDATIVGVEPDEENARLCHRNTEPYGATVVHAAAWTHDGTVTFGGPSPSTFRAGEGGREVPALSMNSLVGEAGTDFIVMDIEGGEQQLLAEAADTDWAERVGCISIEVHEPYTIQQCARDLERVGFQVSLKPAPRDPRVVGCRPVPR